MGDVQSSAVAADGVNKELLSQIVAGTVQFVSQAEGLPMINHDPQLIEVNPAIADPSDASKAACRATAAASAYLKVGHKNGTANGTAAASAPATNYQIITGAVLPEPKKRGNAFGAGAPTKYPFAELPLGGMFFSANSEHAKGDAVKALGSTVSSQNRKYAEETGQTKVVTRAVRDDDNKAKLDADGKKITETVTLPVLKYNRKFTIRPVEAGKQYGSWTAPADGALIARTV